MQALHGFELLQAFFILAIVGIYQRVEFPVKLSPLIERIGGKHLLRSELIFFYLFSVQVRLAIVAERGAIFVHAVLNGEVPVFDSL